MENSSGAPSILPSPLVRLPGATWSGLRLLCPTAAEAAASVTPLKAIDRPHGVIQFFIGGLCSAQGELIEPMEIGLLVDPASVPPSEVIPLRDAVRAGLKYAELAQTRGLPAGFALESRLASEVAELGPTFYCRKKHAVFEARSPLSGAALHRPAATQEGDDEEMPLALVSWDGPAKEGQTAALYAPQRTATPQGAAASFEQMILDQGGVVRLAADWYATSPVAYMELAAAHTCCGCEERQRCYPTGGYAFVVDRLAVINAAQIRPIAQPLGEFTLREAARFAGGGPFIDQPEKTGGAVWQQFREKRAAAVLNAQPRLILTGETGGREVLEALRVKLALLEEAFEQLAASWAAARGPHLCWNDETIRVTWRPAGSAPATAWGFRALLRKMGLQPVVPLGAEVDPPLPYVPAYSDPTLLPAETQEAMRHFGQPRPVTVLVRAVEPKGETARVRLVVEDLGIAASVFCGDDVLNVAGDGWRATVSPVAAKADEGSGVAAEGLARGNIGGLKADAQFDGCAAWWYPRFGEAVDMHALGLLLLESLLAHDERPPARFRAEFEKDRADLMKSCAAVAVEQREAQARTWISARCATDTPASLWTRRNLLHAAAARSAAKLDGLPPALWEAVVTLALRMATLVDGFSYCADRATAAPRMEGGAVLPLVELRGILALLDDTLFQRAAAAERMRKSLPS